MPKNQKNSRQGIEIAIVIVAEIFSEELQGASNGMDESRRLYGMLPLLLTEWLFTRCIRRERILLVYKLH
jgi:hypothetical protein